MSEIHRTNFLTGSALEPLRGYARAVRADDSLFISGTTSMNAKGEVIAPGDAYEQTKQILLTAKSILQTAGFRVEDVVRTRLFVTNISLWDAYAKAHREMFEMVRPASSMVQVAKLVDPRLMIEIEFEAIKGCVAVEPVQLG